MRSASFVAGCFIWGHLAIESAFRSPGDVKAILKKSFAAQY
ncbi:hypothetical protein SeSPB_A4615 [Salmonella enterica subsp. enterica serovar Saintpaul str. SARA29]|nr:hypothetical protein SeSPB_A4615 [Salmonella enterica subsp. enterica serovar Saintpaul str. SARA29]